MAIHASVGAENSAPHPSEVAPVDIEAWTEQAVQAMGSMHISAVTATETVVHGTSVTLEIPLDDHELPRQRGVDASAGEAVRSVYVRRREPLRRDSLKRREALLKGKEGSRRRQRWENDRLLNNPYAQPPLPSDWEVRPTYPVHSVPYYLAPLWDAEFAARSVARKNKEALKRNHGHEEETAKVPKELKEKLKRSKGAKGLLQDLEQEVRQFVENWEEKQKRMEHEDLPDPDSDDDEIVFVGRNGQMSDMPSPRRSRQDAPREKLLFDSPVDDHGASFGRWLVHHIGTYYGLRTWSVTTGNPARREAYVGIPDLPLKAGREVSARTHLPRPLWALI